MGNWKLTTADQPTALTREALASLRHGQTGGMSRRTILRRSIGAAVGLWLAEVTGGTIGFVWPNLTGGFGSKITLGTFDTVAASPAVTGGDAQGRRAVLLPGRPHLRHAAGPRPRLPAR